MRESFSVKTQILNDERIQWLRFVLNPSSNVPVIQDWEGVFRFSRRQAVAGICSPIQFDSVRIEEKLSLKWKGVLVVIQNRNEALNRQAVQLSEHLREAGFRSCILKGQGNAMMYPYPYLRMPGDIDVWVDADRAQLKNYVRSRFPGQEEMFKHIKFPLFKNTPVDLHDTPLKFYRPRINRRLQHWLQENKERQMKHFVRLADTDMDVAIPTPDFNAVYQLGHIMIHVEAGGVGLKHFVDYFYVLKALKGMDERRKEEIVSTWKSLGMSRMARAVMWVERYVLGLPEDCILTAPDEKLGALLIADIFEGGHFGLYGDRKKYRNRGWFVRVVYGVWRVLKVSRYFPAESFFRLLHKIKTAFVALPALIFDPRIKQKLGR